MNISDKLECKISTYGIFKDSERRMLSILENEDSDSSYPIELIRINNKSSFSTLKHSDFLGSMMTLGIKREKIGDLVLENNICYAAVCSDICEYIKNNLKGIAKSPCEVEILNLDEVKIPMCRFQEKNIIVTSMRSDSVIAALCGISRGASTEMIKKGKVLLDYEKVFEKNINVKVGSVITVRGYGKFKIADYIGNTQKNRMKLNIKKYI
ncbi:YlmH/Sll1252 family protein [Clostridium aestuarii]|uniref:YlmH/Sll1252 family protein n=1 Tax=Clostridium aestuarii TaxID=338193 RepID=A0ABT4D040_9CLOT|nr:YlmH/Sll1252 family protein [Clostridium aestuarii]